MSDGRTFSEPIAPELAELIALARKADGPDEITRERVYHRLAGTLALPLIPAAAATGSAAAAGGAAATSSVKTLAIAVLVTAGIGATGFAGWMIYSHGSDNDAAVVSGGESVTDVLDEEIAAPAALSSAEPPELEKEEDTEELTGATAAPAPDTAAPKSRKHSTESERPAETTERLLIEAAREALRKGYPKNSLEILRRHKQKFADGKFAEERDALTVMALAKSGQAARAQKQALRFSARYPGSMFIEAINASVELGQ